MSEMDFLFWMAEGATLGYLDKKNVEEWKYWMDAAWAARRNDEFPKG